MDLLITWDLQWLHYHSILIKVSDIDKKVSQINNMRSMIASLSQSIDKISDIDKKNNSNW